jgi:putative FmdB family regulatory protein
MPIYEYSCGQCGDDFELLVFSSDEPACPNCGSKNLQKKMSACGFSVGYKFKSASASGGSGCSGCSSSNCSSCS